MPAPVCEIWIGAVDDTPLALVRVIIAGPSAVSSSMWKLICLPLLKIPNRPDARVTPRLSVISRIEPPSRVGSGLEFPTASPFAPLRTKAVAIESGASKRWWWR